MSEGSRGMGNSHCLTTSPKGDRETLAGEARRKLEDNNLVVYCKMFPPQAEETNGV